jgi:hypothetical protein
LIFDYFFINFSLLNYFNFLNCSIFAVNLNFIDFNFHYIFICFTDHEILIIINLESLFFSLMFFLMILTVLIFQNLSFLICEIIFDRSINHHFIFQNFIHLKLWINFELPIYRFSHVQVYNFYNYFRFFWTTALL